MLPKIAEAMLCTFTEADNAAIPITDPTTDVDTSAADVSAMPVDKPAVVCDADAITAANAIADADKFVVADADTCSDAVSCTDVVSCADAIDVTAALVAYNTIPVFSEAVMRFVMSAAVAANWIAVVRLAVADTLAAGVAARFIPVVSAAP
jgi:hypothetical protein